MTRATAVLFSCALLASCSQPVPRQAAASACEADRERLLALDESAFDQDLSGGWRALSAQPGCTLAAADLIADYRKKHGKQSGLLLWHEGQLRASGGQYREAAALMEGARKPASDDRAGWNLYVDATIAFLRRDRAGLDAARAALAAVPPPVGAGVPPVVDGYMEVDFEDGQKRRIRWPPNIDVVEGLVRCFDKPYDEAYSDACRAPAG